MTCVWTHDGRFRHHRTPGRWSDGSSDRRTGSLCVDDDEASFSSPGRSHRGSKTCHAGIAGNGYTGQFGADEFFAGDEWSRNSNDQCERGHAGCYGSYGKVVSMIGRIWRVLIGKSRRNKFADDLRQYNNDQHLLTMQMLNIRLDTMKHNAAVIAEEGKIARDAADSLMCRLRKDFT